MPTFFNILECFSFKKKIYIQISIQQPFSSTPVTDFIISCIAGVNIINISSICLSEKYYGQHNFIFFCVLYFIELNFLNYPTVKLIFCLLVLTHVQIYVNTTTIRIQSSSIISQSLFLNGIFYCVQTSRLRSLFICFAHFLLFWHILKVQLLYFYFFQVIFF